LQLEVEAATKAFAQSEAPGLVDAASEGCVEDELHAAAVVEEALGDDGGLGGDSSECSAAGDDVGDELVSSAGADAAGFHEPLCRGRQFDLLLGWWSFRDPRPKVRMSGTRSPGDRQIMRSEVGSERRDLFAEFAYTVAEDGGALRGFSFPEGQARWCAVGIFDEDAAYGFDALDAPAGVAEEDDVAGAGVYGEVLVERGDLNAFGLEDDVVEGYVGDGAAVGDGDHAGAAAGMKMMLDAIAEEVGAVAATGGFDAFGEEGEELVEGFASEIAVGVGAP